MKIIAAFLLLAIAGAFAHSITHGFHHPVPMPHSFEDDQPAVSQALIDSINSNSLGWTAGPNKGSAVAGATLREARAMMGVKRNGFKLPEKVFTEKELLRAQTLPTNFSAALNWPQCPSITTILDQSACGSCWAFGAKEAMWDRYCILANDTKTNVSVDELVACCSACGFGCGGGDPGSAWDFWVQSGLVTDTCLPYPLPSCDHHLVNSTMPCPVNEYPTPACPKPRACNDSETWKNVIHKGKTSYAITKGMAAIQTEIFTNGPVETAFNVYADFLTYTGGVYHHVNGSLLGGHAVKFIGWGVTPSGQQYWIVNNSWNKHWGLDGVFLISRGNNECGIESEVWGGVPLN